MVYYGNWNVYEKNYGIYNIPIDHINTVLYAFYKVQDDGSIISTDEFADYQKKYDDNESFNGNIGQILKLKQSDKKFNVSLCVGGRDNSKNFSIAVSSQENRLNFIKSLFQIFDTYPVFNSITIHWEYLSNDGKNYGKQGNIVSVNDAENCLELIKLLRSEFDNPTVQSQYDKKHYKIMFTSAGTSNAIKYPVNEYSKYVDYFLIQTLNYSSGIWDDVSSHHSNLYSAPYTKHSVDEVINAYSAMDPNTNKFCIAVPAFARGSGQSEGLGEKCNGDSPNLRDGGNSDYNVFPRKNAIEYFDPVCKAAYSYDSENKIFNSYDTRESVLEKIAYIKRNNLGGVMVWQVRGDMPINSDRSLIKTIDMYMRK